jgi:hypothetical protein
MSIMTEKKIVVPEVDNRFDAFLESCIATAPEGADHIDLYCNGVLVESLKLAAYKRGRDGK